MHERKHMQAMKQEPKRKKTGASAHGKENGCTLIRWALVACDEGVVGACGETLRGTCNETDTSNMQQRARACCNTGACNKAEFGYAKQHANAHARREQTIVYKQCKWSRNRERVWCTVKPRRTNLARGRGGVRGARTKLLYPPGQRGSGYGR